MSASSNGRAMKEKSRLAAASLWSIPWAQSQPQISRLAIGKNVKSDYEADRAIFLKENPRKIYQAQSAILPFLGRNFYYRKRLLLWRYPMRRRSPVIVVSTIS